MCGLIVGSAVQDPVRLGGQLRVSNIFVTGLNEVEVRSYSYYPLNCKLSLLTAKRSSPLTTHP